MKPYGSPAVACQSSPMPKMMSWPSASQRNSQIRTKSQSVISVGKSTATPLTKKRRKSCEKVGLEAVGGISAGAATATSGGFYADRRKRSNWRVSFVTGGHERVEELSR